MWGIFLLTMIVTLTFFYLLYYFNNKYTAKEEKAIHGILYINGDYDSLPVYYLSREWEYYPGVLLTPKDDPENYYLRYLSIENMEEWSWMTMKALPMEAVPTD